MPAPTALPGRLHDLWLTTPQGAIKAAALSGARAGVRRDFLRRWDTLTFQRPGQFSATLVLEDNGLISRIESSVAHPVLGEIPVLTQFVDYRLHGGVLMPSRIVQDQGGYPALDLQVTRVAADEAVEITIPDEVRAATERVSVDKVAEGVWFLAGGSHNSVAIELATQIVLVELPQNAGRAQAVLAAANQLVAGKPALTIINTHHHFDHAGGLRTAVAEGRTIFTSALARPYFETVMGAAAAGSDRKSTFMPVDGKTVLKDSVRVVEIHELQGSTHARGLLAVWLPEERLLIEADAYTPGAPGTPPPAQPNANHLNLVQNLDRLGLVPRLILPLHGRVVPAAELYAQVGRPLPP